MPAAQVRPLAVCHNRDRRKTSEWVPIVRSSGGPVRNRSIRFQTVCRRVRQIAICRRRSQGQRSLTRAAALNLLPLASGRLLTAASSSAVGLSSRSRQSLDADSRPTCRHAPAASCRRIADVDSQRHDARLSCVEPGDPPGKLWVLRVPIRDGPSQQNLNLPPSNPPSSRTDRHLPPGRNPVTTSLQPCLQAT
jgi:hypothetical protein